MVDQPLAGDLGPDTHLEHEDHPWTIEIPPHPKRTETAAYRKARRDMNQMAKSVPNLAYGPSPYQDHHGGGLWLKDAEGWFLVRNVVGIEWSAQFCADPAKVDRLRINARRLYAGFPEAVLGLGIRDLLDTPITDAAGVQRWTDSICNASLPLPAALHTGVLPGAKTGGIHHYPTPIAEIELIKRDDFDLWVRGPNDELVALVPVAPRGSGDGDTRVLFASVPGDPAAPTPLQQIAGPVRMRLAPGEPEPDPTILPADHPLSRAAFARQQE
jgi:Family of unknown function (DUF6424)